MKKLLYLQALCLLFFHFVNAQVFVPGKVYDTVKCKADPSQTYALYIPVRGNAAMLPIVYCFDPHAAGALPLRKYKALADSYGFILAGSNNSRNGNDWPTADKIWQTLFSDTRARLKINGSRIYTCGFSGGAKVAGYIAIESGLVKGVIAGGAGLPDGVRAGNFAFSFTGIAGEGDMNMTDLLAFDKELDVTSTQHRLILFDGKHEWAPASTMDQAFCGLACDAMRHLLTPRDTVLLKKYESESKGRVQTFIRSGNLIRAFQECRLAQHILDGLYPDTWYSEQALSLSGRKDYQEEIKVQQALLAQEEQAKEEYMQHFQQQDPGYWSKTISDLQAKAGVNNARKPMYQRLLAYLSLAFYSFSNQLITGRQDAAAGYYVTLYKLADPTNSEAWYFSAILNARKGDGGATEKDLLKAVRCGFRDKQRLEHQPEFARLRPPVSAMKIEKAMGPATQ